MLFTTTDWELELQAHKEMDLFIMGESRSAAKIEDMPEEIQSYVSGLEFDLADLRRDVEYGKITLIYAVGVGGILNGYFQFSDAVNTIESYILGAWLLIVGWVYYRMKRADFFPILQPNYTNNEIKKEWEICCLSESRSFSGE